MLVTRRQLNVDRWRSAGASAQISLNLSARAGNIQGVQTEGFLCTEGELQGNWSSRVILVVVIQEAVMGGPQGVAAAGAGSFCSLLRGRAVF